MSVIIFVASHCDTLIKSPTPALIALFFVNSTAYESMSVAVMFRFILRATHLLSKRIMTK